MERESERGFFGLALNGSNLSRAMMWQVHARFERVKPKRANGRSRL